MPTEKWDLYAAQPTKDATDKWDRFAATAVAQPPQGVPVGSISAVKPPSGTGGKVEQWAQQLINDLKHGTDITGAGSFLKKMGAQPLHAGQPAGVGDLLSSPYLGPMRMVKGGAEGAQGKLWKGTKDVVGGGMEAAQLPSMFMAPEATSAAAKLLPSTEKAAGILENVAKAANHVELPHVNRPLSVAMKIRDFSKSGSVMPKVVKNFMERASKPEPMTYKEARSFYENATRVSFDEANRLTPKSKYMLGQFTKALDTSIHEAAKTVGMGDEYAKGMRAYHSAAKLRDFTSRVKNKAVPAATKGAFTAAGAGAGYKLMEMLIGAPHGR
jgi:hypothetical protein